MATTTTSGDAPLDLSGSTPSDRLRMVRSVRESFMLPPIAYSIDGRVLQLESPLRDAPQVGEHVVVDVDGLHLLAQVTEGHAELRDGPVVNLTAGELQGVGSSMQMRMRAFTGTARVLGSLDADEFLPATGFSPFDITPFHPATDDQLRSYRAWSNASSRHATVDVGRDPRLADARVHLHAKGLTRHTLFCGQSGSGKTFSLGVLLERVLLDTELPLVVLDPNSDHVHLGSMRERADADRVRSTAWTDDEWLPLQQRHAAVAGSVRVERDPNAAVTARAAHEARALVVDLGSLPGAAERHAASAQLLQELWDSRRDRDPVLIVLDEAHDTCPAEPVGDAQRQATELAIAIAGEGRKFGRHLLLSTQRPQKLHPNVVSQCDNLVLLRMNSSRDVDDLAGTFSALPAGLLHRSPTFDQGMAIVGGPLVPHPSLLRIDGRVTPEGGSDVPLSWA